MNCTNDSTEGQQIYTAFLISCIIISVVCLLVILILFLVVPEFKKSKHGKCWTANGIIGVTHHSFILTLKLLSVYEKDAFITFLNEYYSLFFLTFFSMEFCSYFWLSALVLEVFMSLK